MNGKKWQLLKSQETKKKKWKKKKKKERKKEKEKTNSFTGSKIR